MNTFKHKWTLDRHKFMNQAEVKKLRRVIGDKALADLQKGRATWVRFWMVIDLAIQSGMRVAEVASLKVGDCYLSSKEPRLRVCGKGKRVRDVYISRDLREHLLKYLKWKRTMDEPLEKENHLLLSSHGKHYTTRTLQYAFKNAAKEAGLPAYLSFHSCRHSYGTYLFASTKDLRLVQKQLGHANIATTTIYTEVLPEAAVNAVNGLYKGGDDDHDEDEDDDQEE